MESYGFIYRITNQKNGKTYIGQARDIKKRWKGHRDAYRRGAKSALYSVMRKYGPENFSFEVIGQAPTHDLLDWMETINIAVHGSLKRDRGYNLRDGGQTGTFSEETRKRMSDAAKAKVITDEHRKNMSLARIGKPCHSEEEKKRRSEIMMGNTYGKGVPKSEITKQRMRKPKSPEHRAKIAEAIRRRIPQIREQMMARPRDEKGRLI